MFVTCTLTCSLRSKVFPAYRLKRCDSSSTIQNDNSVQHRYSQVILIQWFSLILYESDSNSFRSPTAMSYLHIYIHSSFVWVQIEDGLRKRKLCSFISLHNNFEMESVTLNYFTQCMHFNARLCLSKSELLHITSRNFDLETIFLEKKHWVFP